MRFYILWITHEGIHLWAGPYPLGEIADVIIALAGPPLKITIIPEGRL